MRASQSLPTALPSSSLNKTRYPLQVGTKHRLTTEIVKAKPAMKDQFFEMQAFCFVIGAIIACRFVQSSCSARVKAVSGAVRLDIQLCTEPHFAETMQLFRIGNP